MNYNEQELRAFTTEDIYFFLKENKVSFSNFQLVILCDELLLRKEVIKYFRDRYESLIKKLNPTELKTIDAFDFNYSKATIKVVIHEMATRKLKTKEWFYLEGEIQKGPFTRVEINQLINDKTIISQSYIWSEGMESWKQLIDLIYLSTPYYYDQEFIEIPKEVTPQKPPPIRVSNPKNNSTGSFTILPGVMGLLTFPLWFVLLFILFFTGFSSPLGIVLPLLFSIFMLLSAIPVAIGLMTKKKWAWSMKITTAVLTIGLILFKILIDQASGLWGVLLIYEALILGLLIYGKEEYQYN